MYLEDLGKPEEKTIVSTISEYSENSSIQLIKRKIILSKYLLFDQQHASTQHKVIINRVFCLQKAYTLKENKMYILDNTLRQCIDVEY
jgi:hypothetical protein